MTIQDAAFMPDLPALMNPNSLADVALPRSLRELEVLVKRDLDLVRYPIKSWVLPKHAPDGGRAYDAIIVGGGQSGLATAFGLKRERIDNILIIDQNSPGREGPWNTYARMWKLRTDKYVGGMDLGLPSLSLRSWFEARHGPGAWEAMERLPREMQHEYLAWYRRLLDLPVRNDCRLTGFSPAADDLIELKVEMNGVAGVLWCRTLIFATGIEGNGTRNSLPFIDALPHDRWAHTGDTIDFSKLRGRRVGVLGGAASAFDNAAVAAEAGAAEVRLFHRRAELNPTNPVVWGQFNGFLAHFADLDAAQRWRITHHILSFNAAPPADTIQRVANLPNIIRHAGVRWTGAHAANGRTVVETTDGAYDFDFLILGIGYTTDIMARPELAAHAGSIALWRDVYTPPPDLRHEDLSRAPFLGAHFEFQEITPGRAPWLRQVFNFSRGAQLSMGTMAIGLSGIRFGVPRLVHGVSRHLFRSDADLYEAGMKAWQMSGTVTNA